MKLIALVEDLLPPPTNRRWLHFGSIYRNPQPDVRRYGGQQLVRGGEIMIRKLGLFFFTFVGLLLVISVGSQAQTQLLTRHVREAVVTGQAPLVGHLSATQSMRLVLALPLREQTGLDDFLEELYDPSSTSYRQFLTVEEFTSRFGPSQQDYDAVTRFAEANGFTVVGTSSNRLNVDVNGSVATIEKTFHVTMGLYQHPTENRIFYAPDREPTLDLPLQLWHITGLDSYAIPRRTLVHRDPNVMSNATTGSGPGASFLGSDMRAAYYGGTTLTGAGQSLGLLEYVGTDLADLDTYYANVGQTNSVPITLLSTDGTPTTCTDNEAGGNCDDTEQTIDMTQALGMAPGLSSLVMYVGSSDAAILNAMATASPLNAQLSASWVWSPSDPGTDDPYFEEFAAQGQNYFNAAGDWGAWSSTLLSEGLIFPSDDIYVTSVGGTDLNTSSAGGPWSSETAWSYSGGGISPDDFAIPLWQVTTAAGCTACSQAYRNGPDVAANANFTYYVCADQQACTANEYGGTSFAAPLWAGYMALVNEQAVANGSPTLGFINPIIYALGLGSGYASDFHDITSGSNGYSATAGYDQVTGWGSPNQSGLINALAPFGTSTSTTVASSQNPSQYGQSVTFTATVTSQAAGVPAGTVNFFDGSTSIGNSSLNGSGVATLTISTLAQGTHTITANYSGNITFPSSSGTLTGGQIINSATSATVVISSLNPSTFGQSVTFTATINGEYGSVKGRVRGSVKSQVVTGTVIWSSNTGCGTTPVTSGNPGVATCVTSSLAGGTDKVTTTYSGDSEHSSSTGAMSQDVADFQIAANPKTVTLSGPGQSATTTLTITPLGGFNQTAFFTCSGLPSQANCSFMNNSNGATMTITTAAASARLQGAPFGGKTLLYAMLCPGFLGLVSAGTRKRTRRGMRLLASLFAIGLCSIGLACGSRGSSTPSNPGTPAGTNTVTVTATAGSLSHQATITLTVQ